MDGCGRVVSNTHRFDSATLHSNGIFLFFFHFFTQFSLPLFFSPAVFGFLPFSPPFSFGPPVQFTSPACAVTQHEL